MATSSFRFGLLAQPSTAISGPIASVEAADISAASGTVTYAGAIGSIEAPDVSAATGSGIAIAGTIASVEAADISAATSGLIGTISSTEDADVMVASGSGRTIRDLGIAEHTTGLRPPHITVGRRRSST